MTDQAERQWVPCGATIAVDQMQSNPPITKVEKCQGFLLPCEKTNTEFHLGNQMGVSEEVIFDLIDKFFKEHF